MTAEFDVKEANCIAETGAADTDNKTEAVSDRTKLSYPSCYFCGDCRQLMTLRNTAVYRHLLTVYRRRAFLDIAHP